MGWPKTKPKEKLMISCARCLPKICRLQRKLLEARAKLGAQANPDLGFLSLGQASTDARPYNANKGLLHRGVALCHLARRILRASVTLLRYRDFWGRPGPHPYSSVADEGHRNCQTVIYSVRCSGYCQRVISR